MKPRDDLRALHGESETARLVRLIGGVRSEDELRAFWLSAQGNPAIREPRVIAAKDRRKAELRDPQSFGSRLNPVDVGESR